MVLLQSLVSLTLLLVLMVYFWNPYREDLLRQDLFLIRDRLFDEAAAGRIGFDSECYQYTRTVLNGFIRFGHRISLSRFFTAAMILGEEEKSTSRAKRDEVMSVSSESDRKMCVEFLAEANLAVVRHLGKSPFMFLVLIPLVAAVLTVMGISLANEVVNRFRSLFTRLDEVAYREGAGENARLA